MRIRVKQFIGCSILFSIACSSIASSLQHNDTSVDFKTIYFRNSQAEPELKIPVGKDAFTRRDYDRETIYPFMKKWLSCKKELAENPLLDTFCKKYAGQLTPEEIKAAEVKAKAALEKNPDDVVATMLLYVCAPKSFSSQEWTMKFHKCRRNLRGTFYEYYLTWMSFNCRNQPAPLLKLFNIAMDFAAKNKLEKRESQYIFRIVMTCINSSNAKLLLEKAPLLHPENIWLRNTLMAQAHIWLAWKYRGSDWGYQVTDEGWEGFKAELTKARKCLSTAWAEYQDLPEPATLMITIAMAQGTNAELISWFNKAAAAQADYFNIYSRMSWALRPRWGGSAELLAKLGDACFKSGLYGTLAYSGMLKFYRIAASETSGYLWQKVYSRPQSLKNIPEFLKNWCNSSQHTDEIKQNYFLTASAMCNFYSGNYTETRQFINQLGAEKFTVYEEDLIKHNKDLFPHWLKVSECMKILNGPMGEKIISLEKDFNDGKAGAAIAGLEKLLQDKTISKDTRTFIIELLGRYQLALPAYRFINQNNAFFIACAEGNLKLAEKLLKYGADVNQKNGSGQTPLYNAVREVNLPAVQFLIANGANVNVKDNEQYTPLYRAAAKNNAAEIVKYLISAGAKLDERNQKGMTPLMGALYLRRFANIKALVDAGADVNAKVGEYRVWDYVKYANRSTITEYMKAHGCK